MARPASSTRRFTLVLVALGWVLLPGASWAQPPTSYLAQWGAFGNGPGQFSFPYGIAVDRAGNVFVVDDEHRVQKFTGEGDFLTQWGSYGSGNGQFMDPIGVATDAAGNVYVTEYAGHRVQKFTGAGAYLTQWGSRGGGNGEFFIPFGIATDAAGSVYVADMGNQRIQKFTSDGAYLTQWGTFGGGNGQFRSPLGVATSLAGDVYVADVFNSRIQRFTSTGTFLGKWGSAGTDTSEFLDPGAVGTDLAGNVYVVEFTGNRIQVFTGAGDFLAWFGSYGSGDGEFWCPYGIAADAAGDLFVSDNKNHRVQKFGCPLTVAFDLRPSALNLRSMGRWVSARLEPPAPYSPGDIDVASIRLNGVVPVDLSGPITIEDADGNGIPDLAVKFDRAAALASIVPGESVAMRVSGEIGGECFRGGEASRVTHAPPNAPESPEIGGDAGTFAFALHGTTPHPARGTLRLSLSLPDAQPATIGVYDLAGRRVWSREIGTLGAGAHVIEARPDRALPPGVYLVRLARAGGELHRRAILVP